MNKPNHVCALTSEQLLLGVMLSLAVAVGCPGCKTAAAAYEHNEKEGTKPPPLGETLANLEANLSNVSVLVPAELLIPPIGDGAAITKKMSDFVANAQCFDIDPNTGKPNPNLRRRNPLIPVTTGPLQLQVQGQLTEGGTLTISPTPSLAGTINRQGQQQIMLPITMVSLVNLSSFYMGQQLSFIQYATLVTSSNFQSKDGTLGPQEQSQVTGYVSNILSVAAQLDAITKRAISDFDKDQHDFKPEQTVYCEKRDHGNGPVGSGLVQPTLRSMSE
jgi:hypothetical protein